MQKHSREFLLSEVVRFYETNNKLPAQRDMCNRLGYPSWKYYLIEFGKWKNVIKESGIVVEEKYTDEYLLNELQRFHKEFGKAPTTKELAKVRGYPSVGMYYKRFTTWEEALNKAGLELRERCNVHHYTDDDLANDLLKFYNINNRVPRAHDMKESNGYIPYNYYVKHYGSFITAVKAAGLTPPFEHYTDAELISLLQNLAKDLGTTPTIEYIDSLENFPTSATFDSHFGNYTKALIVANLPLNKSNEKLTGDERCYICNCDTYGGLWSIVDGHRICSRCEKSPRNYINGTLDPNSSTAIGIITEYIVHKVLQDAVICNTPTSFHAETDLISDKYNTINVKSAVLRQAQPNGQFWSFGTHNTTSPHNYICIGFNSDKTKILKVWIIPSSASIVGKYAISITNSLRGLSRAIQYEVDPEPYNKVYQELDIYTLPEFCNLPREV